MRRGRTWRPLACALLAALLCTACGTDGARGAADYRAHLADKYGLDGEALELLEFRGAHTERRGAGAWLDTTEVSVPDFMRFQYGEKIVTVYGAYDDFYYEELVQAVTQFYADRLGTGAVLADPGSTAYAAYFAGHDVPAVDGGTVEDFLQTAEVTLYVQIDGLDPEAEVRALIDRLAELDRPVTVQVMGDLSAVSWRREAPNFPFFDYFYLEGVDFADRYTRISPHGTAGEYAYTPVQTRK